jgi:hypothetical protein
MKTLPRPRGTKKPSLCEHIKVNGLRCASPALGQRRHCYFHHRMHDLRRLRLRHPNSRIQLPLLEDATSIQVAIQEVADAIVQERIDHRRAGLLLFALQTATSNLKNLDTEPKKLRETADPFQESVIARILMEELELDLVAVSADPRFQSERDLKRPPAPAATTAPEAATG